MKKSVTENMTRNYLLALIIIAGLIILAFIILRTVINTEETSAALINVSGRQRMLSQRTALYAFQLISADNADDREDVRRKLTETTKLMAVSNRGLIKGNKRLGLSRPSAKIREIFFASPEQLNSRVDRYVLEANALADARDDDLNLSNPHLRYIVPAAPKLLGTLDKVVTEYQRENEDTITLFREIQAGILSVLLLALLFEGLFIFKPMILRIHEKTARLEAAYEEKLEIADTLQKSLIPQTIPKVPGLEITYFYKSATSYAEVGGDFYDIFEIAGKRWGIVVGDVAGKGIDVAADTAKVKYLLRDRAYNKLSPGDVLADVNNALVNQQAERFTALTYGVYYPEESMLTLANAGNPYPYFTREDKFLKVTAVPISILADQSYPNVQINFKKGDTLIFYTDGLTEARNGKIFFGFEGLDRFVRENKTLDLASLLAGLVEDARSFSDNNLTDDTLVMGLRKI